MQIHTADELLKSLRSQKNALKALDGASRPLYRGVEQESISDIAIGSPWARLVDTKNALLRSIEKTQHELNAAQKAEKRAKQAG